MQTKACMSQRGCLVGKGGGVDIYIHWKRETKIKIRYGKQNLYNDL